MTALEQLRGARALIAEPGTWLHRSTAQDRQYRIVSWRSEEACRFCGLAALWAAAGTLPIEEALGYLILAVAPVPSFAGWNDEEGRTHAEVLAAYDRAIDLARDGGRP